MLLFEIRKGLKSHFFARVLLSLLYDERAEPYYLFRQDKIFLQGAK